MGEPTESRTEQADRLWQELRDAIRESRDAQSRALAPYRIARDTAIKAANKAFRAQADKIKEEFELIRVAAREEHRRAIAALNGRGDTPSENG